jgi:RNA polymerase sigma factor (sigma-70 family)
MAAVPSIGRATAVTPRPASRGAEVTHDLYERYARQIYNFCLHQLGNREEAEDAAQSTFLNAFRGLERGIEPEFESAWLFKIAHNVCLTRQRSSFRRRRVETPGDIDALQDLLPSPQREADELIRLTDALHGMPEQQRRALLLREWQGLSYKEIAEELELSGAAVETLIFRARRSLAQLLSGPQTPKRARRFAFDFGSIGAALKASFGIGKVAAGVAAAVVATTIAGSSEHLRVDRGMRAETPAPAATAPVNERLTLARRAAVGSTTAEPTRGTSNPKPGRPRPTDDVAPAPTAVSAVEDTAAALPRTVDNTVGTAEKTVGETLGSVEAALPPAVTDALAPATELIP